MLIYGGQIVFVEEAGLFGENHGHSGGKLTLIYKDWNRAHLPRGGFELTSSLLTG